MMKNNLFTAGILSVMLVSGLFFAGCDLEPEPPEVQTYTVTYYANGASGSVPSAQTVASGSSVTVAGQGSLSYSGKTFSGWNTNSSGTGASYAAGASLTVNANMTLYAKWITGKTTTYTVTYNANGASGSVPSAQTVASGSSVTVAGQGSLLYSGKTFSGWNTSAAGTGASYAADASLTVNANITLYAQWETSSANSLTWEKVGDLPYGMDMHRANVIDGKIVMTADNIVFTSTDGKTWTEETVLPANAYNFLHQNILFNDKLYTIGGFTEEDDGYWEIGNRVTRSADMQNFTIVSPVTGLTDGIVYHLGLAFNNAMWVIGGLTEQTYDDSIVNNAVWKSTDGITWIKQSVSGLSARAGHAGVVYNGKMYIAGGFKTGGAEELKDVLVSSNGTTWTTLTSNPGWLERNDHTVVANSNGLWLIGGNGGTDDIFLKDVWFSSDGITWTEMGTAPFAERSGHASVIKDGYLYVIGGINGLWDEPNYVQDVWRAYVGGTDINAGSYTLEPSKLKLTNSSSYPIKSLYINGGSNRLTSDIAVNGSYEIDLDASAYTILVYDTQDRYQGFSVTVSTGTTSISILDEDWTSTKTYYTLTYNANGAGGSVPSAQTVDAGASITVAGQDSLSYSGKTFTGWNTSSSGTGTPYSVGASLTINSDISLYAQWESITPTYTVTYNANGAGGTVPSAQTVDAGASITVADQGALSYSGRTFNGWNTNAAGTGASYSASASLTVNSNITLYAQWESITPIYTVTYNANGAGGSVPAAQTVDAGASITLAGQGSLSYSGRTFTGWNTNAAGTGASYSANASLTVSSNITLYAQWRVNTYTYTIKNSYSSAISAVYVRKIGTTSWGSNRISSDIAVNDSISIGTFDAGQYEIKLVSSQIAASSGGGNTAKHIRNSPSILAKPTIRTYSVYCYVTDDLIGNKTITASSSTGSGWSTTNE